MRNRGLHRGADEISRIKTGILMPTRESIQALSGDVQGLMMRMAELWGKRAALYDDYALKPLIEEQLRIQAEVEAKIAEIARKETMYKVFMSVVGQKATEVQREYFDPKLTMDLSHPEAVLLGEVCEFAYA